MGNVATHTATQHCYRFLNILLFFVQSIFVPLAGDIANLHLYLAFGYIVTGRHPFLSRFDLTSGGFVASQCRGVVGIEEPRFPVSWHVFICLHARLIRVG